MMIMVTVFIVSGCGWWVCLGILHTAIVPVVFLVFFTLPHGNKQLGDVDTWVISLMHHHQLKLWSQSVEEGFFGLAFQIAWPEHVVVELLKLHSNLDHALVVVFCQFAMSLLDAVKFVQQGGISGHTTIHLIQSCHYTL